MKNFSFKQIEKNNLRLILVGFFLALLIPTGLLVYQAYDQIKWEAYHQQRQLAEELATRIDDKFNNLIYSEEQRAFSDYSFLNIAGDPAANILQRSPLTNLNISSEINGVIGYFQIDHQGQVSTPILPPNNNWLSGYGISKSEYSQRKIKQQKIFNILKENQLIPVDRQARFRDKELLSENEIETRQSQPDPNLKPKSKPQAIVGQSRTDEGDLAVAAGSSELIEEVSEEIAEEISKKVIVAEPTAEVAASAPKEAPQVIEPQRNSYSAFDSLSKDTKSKSGKRNKKDKFDFSLGTVDDIVLGEKYDKQQLKRKEAKLQEKREISKQKKRASKRTEKTVLPDQRLQQGLAGQNISGRLNAPIKLDIFESEIDPFEFSLLESGQFVLYRKVWRNKHRYIQGILIDSKSFLQNTIKPIYNSTSVSEVSDLAIAYNGDVFTVFNSRNRSSYSSNARQLEGSLLYRTRLSSPLNDVELIFSIQQLPSGPGGKIITWTTLVLFIILTGGFFLMYRLGLRQIRLARQQQDFVSSVSHELKTPLTSIRMYGEMLREGWASEEKKKSYYDYIYYESERLSRLIQNILQLARMTRNEFDLELNPVTVAELVDTIRSKVTSQVERNHFELNLNCDQITKELKVNIDLDQFSQIIINLVDNGIKFANKADKKVIDINCQLQNNNTLVISIRDYGPGIAKDQLKKIFTLFYRSENELTRNTVGTGIGLALVNQITQAMHGNIDVVNHQPGAEFRLSFPILPVSDNSTTP